MRIAIVVTMGGNFGVRGYYNRQEVGLARGLASHGHEVEVHKSVPLGQVPLVEELDERCLLRDVPTRFLGANGWFSAEVLERFRPEAVIMFADIQLSVPHVARWCDRHGVRFLPYVGTMRTNRAGRRLLETVSRRRNFKVLRRFGALAKTADMAEELRSHGVCPVGLMPVGLDFSCLARKDVSSRPEARREFGIPDGPVFGFVGHMSERKRPLALVPLLTKLREGDDWRLALVGDGPMADDLNRAFEGQRLLPYVHWKRRLPNDDMWKLYLSADVMVNLNPAEIFGMSVVEALYYGTPVAAIDAPGPRSILRDGIDGRLCSSLEELSGFLQEKSRWERLPDAGQYVEERFGWQRQAKVALSLLGAVAKPDHAAQIS